MTRKNKKIREAKTEEKLEELLNSVNGMEHLVRRIMYELSQWHDRNSQFVNAIATRRDDLHDPLSDRA